MGKRAYRKMKLAEGEANANSLKDAVGRLVEKAMESAQRVQIELSPGPVWRFRMDRMIEFEFGDDDTEWGGVLAGGADGLHLEEALERVRSLLEDDRALYEIWVTPEDKQGYHWSVSFAAVRESRKGVLGGFGDGAAPHE